MLAGELPGEGIDVPKSLDRNEEPLVGRESSGGQLRHLVTKMILQLVDVVAVDTRGAGDVRPPSRNL